MFSKAQGSEKGSSSLSDSSDSLWLQYANSFVLLTEVKLIEYIYRIYIYTVRIRGVFHAHPPGEFSQSRKGSWLKTCAI